VWLRGTECVFAVGHVGGVGIWDTIIGVQPQEEWNEVRKLFSSMTVDVSAYMVLTCAVDRITSNRALLAGALPVHAHAD
jgi:hypothetical protein